MKKNLGTVDRLIRLAIALALLVYAYVQGSWTLFFASLFVFFEALMSWCIVYQLLGKSSCPIKK